MSIHWPSGIIGALLFFFIGAWAASKWPNVNVIGKITG